MKVISIRIVNLFEIFDYNISFNNNENLLIITGPNGFGKTMILNIIFSLFNRKFLFFQKLVFDNITVLLDDEISIDITRKIENEKPHIKFIFYKKNKEIVSFDYSDELEIDIERTIQKYLPIRRLDANRWIDHRTEKILTTDDLIYELADQLPDDVGKNLLRIKSKEVNEILDSIKVHLIKEQRLFKKVHSVERNYREEKDQTIMIETIQTYAEELNQLISVNLIESFKISQLLDSTYPDRLVREKSKLTEDEYKARFDILKEKQEKLAKNGLYESKQQFLGYSQDDSKALLVYLNDLEQVPIFNDECDFIKKF